MYVYIYIFVMEWNGTEHDEIEDRTGMLYYVTLCGVQVGDAEQDGLPRDASAATRGVCCESLCYVHIHVCVCIYIYIYIYVYTYTHIHLYVFTLGSSGGSPCMLGGIRKVSKRGDDGQCTGPENVRFR